MLQRPLTCTATVHESFVGITNVIEITRSVTRRVVNRASFTAFTYSVVNVNKLILIVQALLTGNFRC